MFFGISKSLKSSFNKSVFYKFLKIGNAAFEPVSYFPNVLGLSKPT